MKIKDQSQHEELFICQCGTPEHQFLIRYDDEDDDVYVDIMLITFRNFWKRLWYGIRYILGYKSMYGYGAFDCVLLKPSDWSKLQKVVDKLKDSYEK